MSLCKVTIGSVPYGTTKKIIAPIWVTELLSQTISYIRGGVLSSCTADEGDRHADSQAVLACCVLISFYGTAPAGPGEGLRV